MDILLKLLAFLVILFGTINLLRMLIFIIGADIYELISEIKIRNIKNNFYPKVSVVMPAYNESKTIIHGIKSILANDYPQDKLEIVVVDDGSKDNTYQIVMLFKTLVPHGSNIIVVRQENGGKAHALNNGIKNYATGELVMCLDSDSYIKNDAIKKAVLYFKDPKVQALAANIKIEKGQGILNLIQRFEYIVCYQMKRSQTFFNIEYIVGGIGSTFRKSFLETVNYYDSDTVTEDIDLTMKILRHGNKNVKVVYGSDVIAYTQSVLTLPELIKQRYRWKWGRCQTFLKNKSMFFSSDKGFTKGLTWFYLPYAIFSEIAFFLEPLILAYIIYISFTYGNIYTILTAFAVITFHMAINVLAEGTIPLLDTIKYLLLAPLMYPLFYILSYVEYIALIKAIWNLPKLKGSIVENSCSWQPVSRSSFT